MSNQNMQDSNTELTVSLRMFLIIVMPLLAWAYILYNKTKSLSKKLEEEQRAYKQRETILAAHERENAAKRSELDEYAAELAAREEAVKSNEENLDEIIDEGVESKLKELSEDIEAKEARIKELESELLPLERKTIELQKQSFTEWSQAKQTLMDLEAKENHLKSFMLTQQEKLLLFQRDLLAMKTQMLEAQSREQALLAMEGLNTKVSELQEQIAQQPRFNIGTINYVAGDVGSHSVVGNNSHATYAPKTTTNQTYSPSFHESRPIQYSPLHAIGQFGLRALGNREAGSASNPRRRVTQENRSPNGGSQANTSGASSSSSPSMASRPS